MEKKKIIDLKDHQSVICYVQMMQGNISRMSSHSGIIKASVCVIYTILITVLSILKKTKELWWVALGVTIISVILDAYYLGIEKIYVEKYNNFIEELNNGIVNEEKIYDMKPRNTKNKAELLANILLSFKSFSIYGFYLLLVVISLLLRFA